MLFIANRRRILPPSPAGARMAEYVFGLGQPAEQCPRFVGLRLRDVFPAIGACLRGFHRPSLFSGIAGLVSTG